MIELAVDVSEIEGDGDVCLVLRGVSAVYHWNTFFHAIMFINDSKKWPIQVLLRQIVIL